MTVNCDHLQGDEEVLPFRQDVFDVVLSNLALHWVRFVLLHCVCVCVCV